MKYGLVCKVCDRLLWTGPEKPKAGDSVPPANWIHALSRTRIGLNERVQWCGCKGRLGYTDVAESGWANGGKNAH